MIIIIISVSILIFGFSTFKSVNDWDDSWTFFQLLGFFAIILSLLAIFIFVGILVNGRTLDSKLEMYSEENIKIETKVKETIRAYMNYEGETYNNLVKEAELETLIIKYPELSSNELIKKEIEIYTENNSNIRSIKEKKINLSNIKFWLYFGK